MQMRFICLVAMLGVCLNGCGYFSATSYPMGMQGGGVYWNKNGLSNDETLRFYWKCYPKLEEMYNRSSMDPKLIIKLEIEGQRCMLEQGFTFKDARYPDEKLCSKSFAKDLGLKSYMIFPACQAKYGKYKK